MARVDYAHVKAEVRAALPHGVYHELLRECRSAYDEDLLSLWASQRENNFVEHMMLLTLLHDVVGWSYNKIFNQVAFVHRIARKTLQHNVKVIRRVLGLWGKSQIVLGDTNAWADAARETAAPPWMRGLRLWLDSTDLDIERRKDRGAKSEHWSGKKGRPARRYMILTDAKVVVRRVWGGYSPKLYDGHWVDMNKQWLSEHLAGNGVVADSHFYSQRTSVPGVAIYAPKPESTVTDPETGANVSRLTAAEQSQNVDVRGIRGRVEQVFASLNDQLQILKRPWAEELSELDRVVDFGIGLHNFKKARLE